MFVGVPSTLGASYLQVPDAVKAFVHGQPAGRLAFDCTPVGLDKSMVMEYLRGAGRLVKGCTVALGDQPMGNDKVRK